MTLNFHLQDPPVSPGTAQPPGSVVALCPLPPCGRSTACWASGTRRCTMLSWWSICRAPASRGRRSQCLLHNGKGMLSSHNHSFSMMHTIWKKEGVPRLTRPIFGMQTTPVSHPLVLVWDNFMGTTNSRPSCYHPNTMGYGLQSTPMPPPHPPRPPAPPRTSCWSTFSRYRRRWYRSFRSTLLRGL